MDKKLALVAKLTKLRKLAEKIKASDQRDEVNAVLDVMAANPNEAEISQVEKIIMPMLREEGEDEGFRVFGSYEEAFHFARIEIFPQISARFRLFKTPKLRQDEYIVVKNEWLYGMDLYQTYGSDRDVLDRLAADGVSTHLHYTPPSGKGLNVLEVFKAWRRDPQTQSQRINSLEYIPGAPAIVGHQFNTFRDVSVEPRQDVDVSHFLEHVQENLCNGNVAYFDYLMNWLAHLVQKPAQRPKTGIAIIGDQGTGKGIFIDFVARMLGGRRNCNTTTSAKDTKSFNTAVGSKLLVVFDEATFSGDHEQSDFMKKLVTEPYVRIEPKGIDAYEVQNYARCFITSNNMESAVPADIGARRWLIIECRAMQGESEWLRALACKIGNNGEDHFEAMPGYVNGFKYYLMNRDIEGFDPTQLPMQDTGMETKIHNHYKRDSVYAFLVDWLSMPNLTLHRMKRFIQDGEQVERDMEVAWGDEILFADFYALYEEMCREAHGRSVGRNLIGKKLTMYGMEPFSKAGNVRYIRMPEPALVLEKLRLASRFDKLVSEEQELYIREWVSDSKSQKKLLAAIAVAKDSKAFNQVNVYG